ncbi:MAG: hypothetical protein ACI837_001396 [Crocinitomicaceae bacterium]|jgi:hypothetical protein
MINKWNLNKVIVYSLAALLGSICFLIYLLYRPEEIVLNQHIFSSFPSLYSLKLSINDAIPLNDFLIYNFPAGLWVLALTVLLDNFRLTLLSYKIRLAYLPITLGIVIELFQLFNFTNGTYDSLDILTMLLFTLIAFQIKKLPWVRIESNNAQPLLALIGFVILFFGNV